MQGEDVSGRKYFAKRQKRYWRVRLRLPAVVNDLGADRLQHRRQSAGDSAKAEQSHCPARQLAEIVRHLGIEPPAASRARQIVQLRQSA